MSVRKSARILELMEENTRLKELVDEMSGYFPTCINCEGKTPLGERTDKCLYLIGDTEYCAKRGISNIAAIIKENNQLREENKELKSPTKKTCGNCVYSKPTEFGRSKVYVECQNPVHVAVYCRQGKNSPKRSRSTLACKSWESRTEDIK